MPRLMVGRVTCASAGLVTALSVGVLSVVLITAAALRLVTPSGRNYSLADSTVSTVSRQPGARKRNISVCSLSADSGRRCVTAAGVLAGLGLVPARLARPPVGGFRVSLLAASLGRVRLTVFWARMREQFGDVYADSVAKDQVLSGLGSRTVNQALADGEDVKVVWRAVFEAFKVPERLR